MGGDDFCVGLYLWRGDIGGAANGRSAFLGGEYGDQHVLHYGWDGVCDARGLSPMSEPTVKVNLFGEEVELNAEECHALAAEMERYAKMRRLLEERGVEQIGAGDFRLPITVKRCC